MWVRIRLRKTKGQAETTKRKHRRTPQQGKKAVSLLSSSGNNSVHGRTCGHVYMDVYVRKKKKKKKTVGYLGTQEKTTVSVNTAIWRGKEKKEEKE